MIGTNAHKTIVAGEHVAAARRLSCRAVGLVAAVRTLYHIVAASAVDALKCDLIRWSNGFPPYLSIVAKQHVVWASELCGRRRWTSRCSGWWSGRRTRDVVLVALVDAVVHAVAHESNVDASAVVARVRLVGRALAAVGLVVAAVVNAVAQTGLIDARAVRAGELTLAG